MLWVGRQFAGALCIALGAASAPAGVVFLSGPESFPGEEEILLNPSSLAGGHLTVQGMTSQSQACVDLYGAGEALAAPSDGLARVGAVDGSLHMLSIALDTRGASFQTLTFTLEVRQGAGGGTVFILAESRDASQRSAVFDLDPDGPNTFGVQAINGMPISMVRLCSNVELDAVDQVRIGGCADTAAPPVSMPLPAAWLSGGALLGAMLLVRRACRWRA